jgi:hypothetical protein
MRSPSCLAVLALLVLAVPASASAADPWSPPAPIRSQTTTPPLSTPPALAANAHGQAIAVADTGTSADIAPHTVASVFTDGAFSDPVRLTGADLPMGPGNGRVLAYGRTRIIGAGTQFTRLSSQAVVAFGRIAPTRASLDTPRGLGPANLHAGRVDMAINSKGAAAVVFPVCRDMACTKGIVYLAVRAAGTSTFHSTRVGEGPVLLSQVAAAINGRGDAMAVWTQESSLCARIRTAGGTLRPRRRVGQAVPNQAVAPSAVLSLHRAQLVGWLPQSALEHGPGPGVAQVAQARDGGPFTTTRLAAIPAGVAVPDAAVRVAYGTHGRAIVAWTAAENGQFLVRRAGIRGAANNPSQTLTGVTTLSQAGIATVLSALVVDPAGPTHALMLAHTGPPEPSTPDGPSSVRASGGEEVTPVATGPAQPRSVDATLLSDGGVLAAWSTVHQGDFWSVRASPTR